MRGARGKRTTCMIQGSLWPLFLESVRERSLIRHSAPTLLRTTRPQTDKRNKNDAKTVSKSKRGVPTLTLTLRAPSGTLCVCAL